MRNLLEKPNSSSEAQLLIRVAVSTLSMHSVPLFCTTVLHRKPSSVDSPGWPEPLGSRTSGRLEDAGMHLLLQNSKDYFVLKELFLGWLLGCWSIYYFHSACLSKLTQVSH